MKKGILMTVLVCAVIFGCSGGGGGEGGGGAAVTSSNPTLSAVILAPNPAQHGDMQNFSAVLTFTDPEGDLDGGSVKFTYDGVTYSAVLGAGFAGIKNGIVGLGIGSATLNGTIGPVTIPFWITDRAGHSSNILHVTLIQT
ncbi:MAG TPA: hypothetical protein PK587_12935, partial [Syntrophales bacterium]|nr:hypothetical protein [Syntrophales bacterium]